MFELQNIMNLTRTNNIFSFFLKKRNTRLIDDLLIFLLIVVLFRLATPFDLSSSIYLKPFTTYMIMGYFCILTLITFGLRKYSSIPFILLYLLTFLFIIISNLNNSQYLIVDKDVNVQTLSFLFSLSTIVVLSKPTNFIAFFRWFFIVSCFFIILSFLGIHILAEILPTSKEALAFSEHIEGQAQTLGEMSHAVSDRLSFLWFDSNNFGFLIVRFLVFLIVIAIFYVNKTFRYRLILYLMLLISLYVLLKTYSRGSVISLFFAILSIFFLAKKMKWDGKMIKLMLVFILIILFIDLFAIQYFDAISERFMKAFGVFNKSGGNAGGLETGRIDGIYTAYYDFIQKPILGHGSGFRTLNINGTGNHLGYLNNLVNYGIIGSLLSITVLFLVIKQFFKISHYVLSKLFDSSYIILFNYMIAFLFVEIFSGFFRAIDLINVSVFFVSFSRYLQSAIKSYAGKSFHQKITYGENI